MVDTHWRLTGNAGTNPPDNFLGTTDNHPLVLKTDGTEAMRIHINGNVGIGTTTPAFKLQVTAPDQLGLVVQGPQAAVGAGLQLQTTGPDGRGWELLATGATSAQGGGKFNIRDLGTASDDFTITSAGNIGIGTTSPEFKLEVVAADQLGLAVQGPSTGVGAGLQLQSAGPGGRGWELLATGAASAQGGGKFNIRDLGDGSDDFTITSAGNVGIGTTNPTEKLTVAGQIAAGGLNCAGVVSQIVARPPFPFPASIVGQTNISGRFSAGVRGINDEGHGVQGQSQIHIGVEGTSDSGTAIYAESQSGYGLFATTPSGPWAGFFQGNVFVSGFLAKPGGGFQIDHPLDPANKHLNHSFVESPDMKNVYDGVVVLDPSGEAVVELPEWFEALNRDFRYQLTALGAPGPNLYIAEEISHNRFKVAGGTSGIKVSWQVTGIRKDPWAQAHSLTVEETKPDNERGYYLHPELYDQPEEKGLMWARQPEMMHQKKEQRQQMRSKNS